ncbi:dihydroorotase [bacterium AH-315-C07]|nr:dihydroorotase [bacterium AH-315-C07]
MSLLIKSAQIIDPISPFHNTIQDILIVDGKIVQIAADLSDNSSHDVFNATGQLVSPGWIDINVNLCDPGFEHKEDIASGCLAAANGGFTGICALPNSDPPPDGKSNIEYIKKASANNIVDVYPIGTISKKREGKELTEIYDMADSGSVAFSDGNRAVDSSGLFLRALLYVKSNKGLVMSTPNDRSVSNSGMINEGVTSTRLGLKGIPAIAEELMVNRDINLVEYTNSRIHFRGISTIASVELVRKAKQAGLNVTADVAIYNLIFDESSAEGFDTNFKVLPPLRTKKDIKALLDGIEDGTLDMISSHHTPHEDELKKCEFQNAAFGMIGLETCYPLLSTHLSRRITTEKMVEMLAINPRKLLNLQVPSIKKNTDANLTVFDPKKKWTLNKSDIKSKSCNTPFINKEFQGKPTAVYNKGIFREIA